MAEKFLSLVAKDLLNTYGNNLSQVTMVIPGKRARLFMNQYLALQSDKPVWSPRYQTIDELFLELSPYKKAEQIETVCLLYKIYRELVDNPEELDDFYSWGEIILADFDDIDKHMANADKLFANVYDHHAIQTDYITPEQAEALSQFFKNFSKEQNTELKRRFLRLWEIMPKLYHNLREELKSRGYLYSGALYRDVVERYQKIKTDNEQDSEESRKLSDIQRRTYAFVGFNVVDECESSLFRLLGEEHTRFYWDYDEMYINDMRFNVGKFPGNEKVRSVPGAPWEAGLFLRENLRNFPNRLPKEYFDNLRHLQDITFIATSTDNAQARYIPSWIKEQLTEEENDTAIVLCDEHMLQPVLHSLPEDKPEKINVTMGFPLTDTPIYSFLSILTAMQIDGWDASSKRFRNSFKEKVIRHPYYELAKATLLDEKEKFIHQDSNISLLYYLQSVITELGSHYAKKLNKGKEELAKNNELDNPNEENDKIEIDVYDQLYGEALFQAHKVINRFITLIEQEILDVHPITLRRLMRNVLGTTSIPFHGEPAIGMQVMGLMETRNLDFSHLLMLNVGEGTMPKKSDDNSLIPYPLREAFGLTTIRHRISVFAYYFFRLLQRTDHVTLMYNENSSGVKNNEMSRFMRQLMAESNLPIRHIRLTPQNEQFDNESVTYAEKTKEIVDSMLENYSTHTLSPTAINAYLDCPLKFYFKYVAKMKVDVEHEDGISPAFLGNTFHDASESFYRALSEKYGTKTFTADMLRQALDHKETQIAKHINMAEYDASCGLPLIVRNVIMEYLCQLIRYDLHHAPITIEDLEEDYHLYLDIAKEGEQPMTLKIGGRVDRLDKTENGMQVVDYKTGGSPETLPSLEAIFKHEAKNAGYFFQTILYSLAVSHRHNCGVKPSLFYVHRAVKADAYDPSMAFKAPRATPEPIEDVRVFEKEFLDRLKEKLRELFNPDINFCATSNSKKCQYCDYIKLCGKKIKTY